MQKSKHMFIGIIKKFQIIRITHIKSNIESKELFGLKTGIFNIFSKNRLLFHIFSFFSKKFLFIFKYLY